MPGHYRASFFEIAAARSWSLLKSAMRFLPLFIIVALPAEISCTIGRFGSSMFFVHYSTAFQSFKILMKVSFSLKTNHFYPKTNTLVLSGSTKTIHYETTHNLLDSFANNQLVNVLDRYRGTFAAVHLSKRNRKLEGTGYGAGFPESRFDYTLLFIHRELHA